MHSLMISAKQGLGKVIVMRLLVISALLLLPVAAAAEPPKVAGPPVFKPLPAKKQCASNVHRADVIGKVEGKRLGELPPGMLYFTVWRNVNGCPDPLIARYRPR
jgi:hypothetical protein